LLPHERCENIPFKRGLLNSGRLLPSFSFGFEIRNGYYIALPEKAFLDEIYFMLRGETTRDFDEMSIKKLSLAALKDLSRRFPPYVRNYIDKMKP
jgi:hypothetical protein